MERTRLKVQTRRTPQKISESRNAPMAPFGFIGSKARSEPIEPAEGPPSWTSSEQMALSLSSLWRGLMEQVRDARADPDAYLPVTVGPTRADAYLTVATTPYYARTHMDFGGVRIRCRPGISKGYIYVDNYGKI